MKTTAGWISLDTLRTKCISMFKPDLPGYLPTILVAVRSKSVASSSVQMAFKSMVLPDPSGPTNNNDFVWGAFSLRYGEPKIKVRG